MGIFDKRKLDHLEALDLPDTARHTILVVDDEDANLRVISSILSPLYRLITASDGQQALEIIEQMESSSSLACIICDQRMPRLTGLDLIQRVNKLMPRVVCIIVTAFIDLDTIVGSINKAEIYQFIIKPFDSNDFALTVKRAVETFELKQQLDAYHRNLEEIVRKRTQELASKNEELGRAYKIMEEISLVDSLTGLRNRRYLFQHLEEEVVMTLRQYDRWLSERFVDDSVLEPYESTLAFFMVDIDHFKAVNDVHGHSAGDQVLVQMKERLQSACRESDYIVRWGGEEFLVVARGINPHDTETLAARICASVLEREFELDDGVRLSKCCSVGYACFPFLRDEPRALNWQQVVAVADQALYVAKRGGRNAWVGLHATDKTRHEGLLQKLSHNILDTLNAGELSITGSIAIGDVTTNHTGHTA